MNSPPTPVQFPSAQKNFKYPKPLSSFLEKKEEIRVTLQNGPKNIKLKRQNGADVEGTFEDNA